MKPFYVELLRDENGQEIPAGPNGERPTGIAINEHLIPVASLGADGQMVTNLLTRISVLWLDVNMRSYSSPAYHTPEQLRWLDFYESQSELDGDYGDEEDNEDEDEGAKDTDEIPESAPEGA